MELDEIAKQAAIEHEMLKHIAAALRATMQWAPTNDDISRKLGSLRFISQSFQRHLEHVMALEEYDGYLNVVTESYPEYTERTQKLRCDHDRFRDMLGRINYRLERMSPSDAAAFAENCSTLAKLLEEINDHNQRETELIQEAFFEDVGGEGG
ncbi:MAG TPA: hemerythrin domain-containing protein [Pirellulales bacterium]|nr:hemerythrin domain-containing protein [Pirellulales bacterium]